MHISWVISMASSRLKPIKVPAGTSTGKLIEEVMVEKSTIDMVILVADGLYSTSRTWTLYTTGPVIHPHDPSGIFSAPSKYRLFVPCFASVLVNP